MQGVSPGRCAGKEPGKTDTNLCSLLTSSKVKNASEPLYPHLYCETGIKLDPFVLEWDNIMTSAKFL